MLIGYQTRSSSRSTRVKEKSGIVLNLKKTDVGYKLLEPDAVSN